MDDTRKYMELLRFCLNDNVAVPESIKEINWHKLLEFSTAQTIQGVFARTILMQDGKMRKEDFMGNKPTDDDVMEWVFEAHRLRKENEILFKRADKASEWFLENGFPNCILKGQGNALMYPDPYARVAGDIDIWLDGGREKILEFTTKYYQHKPTSIHVDFPMFADAGVEVHFRPSYMLNPFIDKKLVKYFEEVKASQFGNVTVTPDGKYKFFTPTNDFNVFYQLLHLYRHLANEGIGLRQIIDYFYLLRKCKADGMGKEEKENFIRLIKKFKMTRFTSAIMYIVHQVFGLPEDYLLYQPDKKEGEFLLNEVLLMGNFGKAETRKAALETAEGHFKRFLIYEGYNMRLLKHYPSEVIWRPWRDIKASWKRRKEEKEE
ncbi:MAG: nucleotidyltransferase family protein [Prevotella sp.]|nr:nucleotidyltransferase family protein [Prevotella sp.]